MEFKINYITVSKTTGLCKYCHWNSQDYNLKRTKMMPKRKFSSLSPFPNSALAFPSYNNGHLLLRDKEHSQ